MKKFLLCAVAFPALLNAQTSYDIKFDNGETKKVTMNYDDPNNLPRFNLTYCFFGFTVTNTGMLSYQLRPEYRINDKMMVSGIWTSSYSRKLDDNIPYNSSYQNLYKKTSDFSLLFHYSFFTFDKPVTKKVPVDYGGTTVYIAKLPRNIAKSFVAEAGINHFVSPTDMELKSDSSAPSLNTGYSAMNYRSWNGMIGLSFYKHESYQVTSNGISRSYFRYFRLYARLLLGLSSKYTVNSFTYDPNNPNATPQAAEVTSGYIAPTAVKTGWLVGADKQMGVKNQTVSLYIGFEFGDIPNIHYSDEQLGATHSPSGILMIHFGVGFGTKIQK